MKIWQKRILAYLLWALLLALGFWFGLIGTNAFRTFLGTLTANNQSFTFVKQMIVVDRVLSVGIWLLWLVMMVITEERFRRAAQSGGLSKWFARFTGPLLILIFLADFYLLSVTGFSSAGWLRWLLLAVELVGGIALTIYGQPFRRLKLARSNSDF